MRYNRENEGGKHYMTGQKNARAKFKGIPFKEDDHALIDNARTRLSYYRGKQLSLADTVMEGQRLLDKEIRRKYEKGDK